MQKEHRVFFWLPVIFFILSLILPSVGPASIEATNIGLTCLLLGPLTFLIFTPVAAAAWCANIFFVVLYTSTLQRRPQTGLKLAITGFVLASLYALDPKVVNEGGDSPARILIGYYFWLCSFFLLVIRYGYLRRSISVR